MNEGFRFVSAQSSQQSVGMPKTGWQNIFHAKSAPEIYWVAWEEIETRTGSVNCGTIFCDITVENYDAIFFFKKIQKTKNLDKVTFCCTGSWLPYGAGSLSVNNSNTKFSVWILYSSFVRLVPRDSFVSIRNMFPCLIQEQCRTGCRKPFRSQQDLASTTPRIKIVFDGGKTKFNVTREDLAGALLSEPLRFGLSFPLQWS